jgi:hypothetical protein
MHTKVMVIKMNIKTIKCPRDWWFRKLLIITLLHILFMGIANANSDLYELQTLKVNLQHGRWNVTGPGKLNIAPRAKVISTEMFPENLGPISIVEPYYPLRLSLQFEESTCVDSLEIEVVELTRSDSGKIIFLYQDKRMEIDRPTGFQLKKYSLEIDCQSVPGKHLLKIGTVDGRFGVRSVSINISVPLTPKMDDPRWVTHDGAASLINMLSTDFDLNRRRLAAEILTVKSKFNLKQGDLESLANLLPKLRDERILVSLLELFLSSASSFSPQVEQQVISRLPSFTDPENVAFILKLLRSFGSDNSDKAEQALIELFQARVELFQTTHNDWDMHEVIYAIDAVKDLISLNFVELLASELAQDQHYIDSISETQILRLIANSSSEGAVGATTPIVSLFNRGGWSGKLSDMATALFAIDPNITDEGAQTVILRALQRDRARDDLIVRILDRKERGVQWPDALLSALIEQLSTDIVDNGDQLIMHDERTYNILARLDYKGNKLLETIADAIDALEVNLDALAKEVVTPIRKKRFTDLLFIKAFDGDQLKNVESISMLAKPFYREISTKHWLSIYRWLQKNRMSLDESDFLLIYDALALIPPPADRMDAEDVLPLLELHKEATILSERKKKTLMKNIAHKWLGMHPSGEIDVALGRILLESDLHKKLAYELITSQSRKGAINALVSAAGRSHSYVGVASADELLLQAQKLMQDKVQHVNRLLKIAESKTEGLDSFPFYLSVSEIDRTNRDVFDAAINWWKSFPHERFSNERVKQLLANLDPIYLSKLDPVIKAAYNDVVKNWRLWREKNDGGYSCSIQLIKKIPEYSSSPIIVESSFSKVSFPETECNLARFSPLEFSECKDSKAELKCKISFLKQSGVRLAETDKADLTKQSLDLKSTYVVEGIKSRSRKGFGYVQCLDEIEANALSIVKRYSDKPGAWALDLIVKKVDEHGLSSRNVAPVTKMQNDCIKPDYQMWREWLTSTENWSELPEEIEVESLRFRSIAEIDEEQLDKQVRVLERALAISSDFDTAVLCNVTKSLVLLRGAENDIKLGQVNDLLKQRLKKVVDKIDGFQRLKFPSKDNRVKEPIWNVRGEDVSEDRRFNKKKLIRRILRQIGDCKTGSDELSVEDTVWRYLAEEGDEEAFEDQIRSCCNSWHVDQLETFGSNTAWARRILTWVLLERSTTDRDYSKVVSWFSNLGAGGDINLLHEWIREEKSKPVTSRRPKLIRKLDEMHSIVSGVLNEHG